VFGNKKSSEYPECEKLAKVVPNSQKIGEFLDWFESDGRILAHYIKKVKFVCTKKDIPCSDRYWDLCVRPSLECVSLKTEETDEKELVPLNCRIENLLAVYFGIDLDKVEKEKQSILNGIRGVV
jgi:hypothetical protein